MRPAIRRCVEATGRGLWAVGYASYESAPAFDDALAVRGAGADLPLVHFGIYEEPQALDTLGDVVQALASAVAPPPGQAGGPDETAGRDHGAAVWTPGLDLEGFKSAIARIKSAIREGNTYQVNFTFPLFGRIESDPFRFFVDLVTGQSARNAAFLHLQDAVLCSASPELFFELSGTTLTCRPMKGTAPRGATAEEDIANETWLRDSAKNRAENAMIVDMIRNDMSRVARVGSVRVSTAMDIERYPTVLQMTSTVVGETTANLADVFGALFPCASITGAPKPSTTHLISELEESSRGPYTGAVGYFGPNRTARFSVAIRTAVIDLHTSEACYGVGSGVVWDSDADEEYDECLLKARVLSRELPEFDLLETIRWEPTDGFWLLEPHIERLLRSAATFGRVVDQSLVRARLHAHVAGMTQPRRVRLLIGARGQIRVESVPLPGTVSDVPLAVSAEPIDSGDLFLQHKTTHRGVYDRALARHPEADDVLLWNERGEITESCLANVVFKAAEELVTPATRCGLLPGTLRAELLATGEIREAVIRLEELHQMDAVYLINSVRVWRRARLVSKAASA